MRNLSGTAEFVFVSIIEMRAFCFCKYMFAYTGRKEYK